jgi:hypothetical protein
MQECSRLRECDVISVVESISNVVNETVRVHASACCFFKLVSFSSLPVIPDLRTQSLCTYFWPISFHSACSIPKVHFQLHTHTIKFSSFSSGDFQLRIDARWSVPAAFFYRLVFFFIFIFFILLLFYFLLFLFYWFTDCFSGLVAAVIVEGSGLVMERDWVLPLLIFWAQLEEPLHPDRREKYIP